MDDTRLRSVVYGLNGTKKKCRKYIIQSKKKTETECTELEGGLNASHQHNNSGILLHTHSIQWKKEPKQNYI